MMLPDVHSLTGSHCSRADQENCFKALKLVTFNHKCFPRWRIILNAVTSAETLWKWELCLIFINPGAKHYWLDRQDPSDISVLDRPRAAQAQSDWGLTKSNMFEKSCRASTVNESRVGAKNSPVLNEFTPQRNVHRPPGLSVPHTAVLV